MTGIRESAIPIIVIIRILQCFNFCNSAVSRSREWPNSKACDDVISDRNTDLFSETKLFKPWIHVILFI